MSLFLKIWILRGVNKSNVQQKNLLRIFLPSTVSFPIIFFAKHEFGVHVKETGESSCCNKKVETEEQIKYLN